MERYENCWVMGLKIAMAYTGTVIGAGFASGQEILQFFTRFGYPSFLAILLSTVLFILVGLKLLSAGSHLQVKSFRGITGHVFGPLSPLVDIYLCGAFLLLCGAMYAGAGAIFKEHFGRSFWMGAALTAILALGTTLYGVKGILAANIIIVPLIIVFNVLIFFYVIGHPLQSDVNLNPMPLRLFPLIRSGITYASFNLILSIGVLAPMGGSLRDARPLYIGSILGGCILGLMLTIGNYSLLQYTPEVFAQEIPMLYILTQVGKGVVLSYGVIIWFGVFTTAIGNLFSATTLISDVIPIKPPIVSALATLFGLLLCGMGFSSIVSTFYPMLGIIGFITLTWMLFTKTKYEKVHPFHKKS